MVSKKALVLAGVGALLLTPAGRAHARALPTRAKSALRRRRSSLPKGVEEFPRTLVDNRHGAGASTQTPVSHAETPTEVVAEHYREHPAP